MSTSACPGFGHGFASLLGPASCLLKVAMKNYYYVVNTNNSEYSADGLAPEAFGILAKLEAQKATVEVLWEDTVGYITVRLPDGRLLHAVSNVYFASIR